LKVAQIVFPALCMHSRVDPGQAASVISVSFCSRIILRLPDAGSS
jgi:hypothetical protein